MIELIFLYFMMSRDLSLVNQPVTGELCRRIHLANNLVEPRAVFAAAEKRWADDESAVEEFYAFWENADSCNPDAK